MEKLGPLFSNVEFSKPLVDNMGSNINNKETSPGECVGTGNQCVLVNVQ